jgi:hypothetical protein
MGMSGSHEMPLMLFSKAMVPRSYFLPSSNGWGNKRMMSYES